jgi:hypothetical protein
LTFGEKRQEDLHIPTTNAGRDCRETEHNVKQALEKSGGRLALRRFICILWPFSGHVFGCK